VVTQNAETKGNKSRMMVKYEAEHSLKLEEVIPKYYQKDGSLEATAKALGININTLYGWMLRLGITIKKVVAK